MPHSFWDEPLGKMLSQAAKLRSVDMDDLMSIGDAAQYLGVTRPTIMYRWMDNGTLNFVRDEISGRTFVIRRDVDALHELLIHAGANSSGSYRMSRISSARILSRQPVMLLAVDLSNTNTKIGLYADDAGDDARPLHIWRISTNRERTADEWWVTSRRSSRRPGTRPPT